MQDAEVAGVHKVDHRGDDGVSGVLLHHKTVKDNPPVTFAIAACETQNVSMTVLPVFGLSGERNVKEMWGTMSKCKEPVCRDQTISVLQWFACTAGHACGIGPRLTRTAHRTGGHQHDDARHRVELVAAAVRRAQLPWLFAFAGGTRGHGSDKNVNGNGFIRDAIIEQCAQSRRCGLLRRGTHGQRNDCYAPGNVMRLFKSAAFCLQPQGNSICRVHPEQIGESGGRTDADDGVRGHDSRGRRPAQ
ncbi:hypothetical protein ACQ4PT_057364 [Festuca glaucescens]